MQNLKNLSKDSLLFLILVGLLLIPAYFTNITRHTMNHDESLRALVALEMKLSGDYITPTMGAKYYYKKPPIYNWIVASYYKISNDYSELATRLPMLLSLFAFALTIFYVTKRKYGLQFGIIAGLLYLIYPRIIGYETLYGLIDISYSWLVFITFIATYYLFKKEKYLALFALSYTLTAITFLMKGIPSIAYQGITLLIVFVMGKKFLKLFSWQHIVGILPLFTILGAYYYSYYLKNPDNLEPLLTTIFNESADKSAIAFGFFDIVLHAFQFTGEIMYNYLPATFVLFFLFHSKSRQFIKNDDFLIFLLVAFVGNISIYFISPTTYMRYVLPHMGLLVIAFVVLYYKNKEAGKTQLIKYIDVFFLMVSYLILAGLISFGFIPDFNIVSYKWAKVALLSIVLLGTIYWFQQKKNYRMELFIIALLVFKLGFNMFIIPARAHNNFRNEMREKCRNYGKEFQGKKVILTENIVKTTHFYLSAAKQELIPYSMDTTHIDYLMGHTMKYDITNKEVVDSFRIEMTPIYFKIIKW